jgi:hypothetical protein
MKSRQSKRSNHDADSVNRNKGTAGTNVTLDKNQGNRGRQITEKRNARE